MRIVNKAHRYTILYLLLTPFAVLHADTTGATFLKLGGGAAPAAMAGACTAIAGSVDSLYCNPAGTARLPAKELSFTHSDWLEDTGYDVLSYGHPLAHVTLSASVLRLGGGTQEGRDALRQKTGDFSAEDFAGMLSLAAPVGSYLGTGASLKYLHSHIENVSASAVAADLGVLGRVPGQRLWLGASALNLGSGYHYLDQVDRLPLTLNVGSAFQLVQPFTLTLDVSHEPYENRSELRTGAQYSFKNIDFRVGYLTTLTSDRDTELQAVEKIRGGFGVHFSRYRADYALISFGDLGLTHRFTLSIRFGAEADTYSGPLNLFYPEPGK